MSKYLHPDKHGASATFQRVARAYKVLSDEKQRMIYDLFGEKGLETSWAVADTLKTPEEMMREFHRLERVRREEEEAAATSLEGEIYTYVDASSAVAPPFPGASRALVVERMLITQTMASHVSHRDTLELEGYVLARNGSGAGGVVASLKRVLSSRMWGKVGVGNTTSRLILHRDFSSLAFGELMGSYSCRENSVPGFEWALLLGRQLSQTLLATVCFRWGLRDSVEVALASSGGPVNKYRVAVEATPDTLTLSSRYGRKISEDSTALAEASASTTGVLKFALGAERSVSRRSVVGLQLALSNAEGITLEAWVSRAGFKFSFPVLLSPRLDAVVAVTAAAVPSALVALVQVLIINPNRERRKARRIEQIRRDRLEVTIERAAAVAESMRVLAPVAEERRQRERAQGGLVIEQAWYGNIEGVTPHIPSPHFPQYINVADQLQLLVVQSRLSLPAASKADSLDFYDCCPGEAKQLYVRYTFHSQLHEVLVDDEDPLVLARPEHRVEDPSVSLWNPVVAGEK